MKSTTLQTRAEIGQLVAEAESLIPIRPVTDCGELEWHGFELAIWDRGERIRQLIATQTSLRRDQDLQSRFVRVGTNRNARHGRQSFLMLLGYTCCRIHAKAIASQLGDSCVTGQVIDTLLRMRAPDFVSRVEQFLGHETSWIRKLATTYCEQYGA